MNDELDLLRSFQPEAIGPTDVLQRQERIAFMETIAHGPTGPARRTMRLRPRRGILLGIAIALVAAVGTAGATGVIPETSSRPSASPQLGHLSLRDPYRSTRRSSGRQSRRLTAACLSSGRRRRAAAAPAPTSARSTRLAPRPIPGRSAAPSASPAAGSMGSVQRTALDRDRAA